MALMGIIGRFEGIHGSRQRRLDHYTIEAVISGPIQDGFVGGIDHRGPIKKLEQIADSLDGRYLDDIVGRATNENIAQFFMFQLSNFPIDRIRVTESEKTYVELSSGEFDEQAYPAQLEYNKGHSFLLRENPEIAKNHLTNAIEMNGDFAQAYNLRGRCLKYMGAYEEALSDFQKAIDIDPDFGEAWRNLGNAYLYLDDYEKMIPAFDMAVELKPDSALAINNRGYGYYLMGEFEKALQDHIKAIDIDPNYSEAHYDKAMALKALGKRHDAVEALVESRRLKKCGEDTYHGIKMY
jgi:tetratricopeptide (TPR) repeat protein